MLNSDQVNAVRNVLSKYRGGDKSTQLTGGPGTGKTFTVGKIAEALKKEGAMIAMVASDNVAVNVSKSMAIKNGWYHMVSYWGTVHKLLGIIVDDDGTSTETGAGSADYFDVVIVDESSKLGRELIWKLEHSARFILYVGDPRQLLPVGEDEAVAFDGSDDMLKQNVRQSNDQRMSALTDAIKLAMDLKKDGISRKLMEPFSTDDHREWEKLLGNDWTAICFRNAEADRLNRIARANMKRTDEYNIGDKVIFKKSYYRKTPDGRNDMLFAASEIGVVEHASRYTTDNGFPMWSLRIRTDNNHGYVSVYDTTEDNNNIIDYLLTSGYKPPRMASMSYAYAITAHRAQGMTIDNVAVNMVDFRSAADRDTRQRLFYVAVSRASKSLRILV